jgi:hypothetical protein
VQGQGETRWDDEHTVSFRGALMSPRANCFKRFGFNYTASKP